MIGGRSSDREKGSEDRLIGLKQYRELGLSSARPDL
jgi:hypothetical protein